MLRELLLQGNKLTIVPANLIYVKDSLKSLYLGENLIESFTVESFLGMCNYIIFSF